MTGLLLGDGSFPGRVWVASGCGGTGRELSSYVDLTRLGAFVTRTITLQPRPGSTAPRIRELPGGLLHDSSEQSPGLDSFLATELPWLAQQQLPVVVSIAAREPGEYAELARRVGASPGVRGVEVNLSAPAAADDPQLRARMTNTFQLAKVLGTVRAEVPRGVPVLAKLGPGDDVVALARAAGDSGADAVVLVNAAPARAADGRSMALSGPALHPLALRAVARVREEVPALPVVAVGGIGSGTDARAFLDLGAVAVQVGTACLSDPAAAARIADALDAQPDRQSDRQPDIAPRGGR
ncbi:MAG TPA: tRNA-dihydrouridine synthase [Marmoricola sp.]